MWTLPNLLTAIRLAAAPATALVFVLAPRPAADWAALALFTLAAATDWLDGRIARAWKVETEIGRMLDPIADKAMTLIALALLLGLYGLEATLLVPVALIFLREIAVSGLREFLAGSVVLNVTSMAKWKTTLQLVALTTLLAVEPIETVAKGWGNQVFWPLGLALLWFAAVLTALTGWEYFSKGVSHIRGRTR